ncbi:MAG: S8 family peptidase [Gemmatimonadota bacterium]
MITLFSAVLSALCAGCVDPDRPMGLRLGVPEPTVTTYTDGCARFQIRFDDGVAQVTSTMPPAAPCLQGDLYLFTDTAAVLDPVAGRLRIGVKLENRGTVPIVIPVRLRFNADSVILLNANQTPYGVPSDLLATNADSVDATGRQAKWFMDMSLAPAGQPQVLMPGATTVRRWLEFGGTTWAPRVRIKVQLFGAQGQNVPAMAPDSRPAALMDMSRIHTPSQGFPFARDLLVVRFFPGTSLAERTAAIHQVNGVVAGGYPDPTSEGGAYLVKLPADSTLTTITQAEAVLRSRQSVRFVWKHHLLEVVPSYIRPTDGQGWERSTWRPGGDLLLTPNPLIDSWGIQFVRAPLAWGCSLGDTAARVGFVDYGFQTNVPDLPSSYFSINGANLTGDTLRHGTRVLSVVGAIGNNGTRMAGLAWRARFGFRDPTHVDSLGKPAVNPSTGRRAGYFEDALLNIGALADSGVQVINISLGADSVPVIDLLDTVATDRMRGYAGAVAGRLRFGGRTPPVLVVAAGNVPQGDPRGSLFPFLKDSLRDHVIVVAAMKRDGGLQNAPSGSAYIDVVAPGEDIYVIDELADWSVGGASYATPIVTGIAALLKSFDPTLSTDSLRLLIIEGANRSGKVSGGYPVADAYESLKLAAGRTGAPICGNVVLSQYASITGGNTTVKVRRQAGQPYETIASFTLPADTSVSIDVVHGGKQLVRTRSRDTRHMAAGCPAQWNWLAVTVAALGHNSDAEYYRFLQLLARVVARR